MATLTRLELGELPAGGPESQPTDLRGHLQRLAARWKRETVMSSSSTTMILHPAYQQIIGKGAAALPFLFEELSEEPNHWFWALSAITGEDPVPPEARGTVPEMTRIWLEWGSKRGYC